MAEAVPVAPLAPATYVWARCGKATSSQRQEGLLPRPAEARAKPPARGGAASACARNEAPRLSVRFVGLSGFLPLPAKCRPRPARTGTEARVLLAGGCCARPPDCSAFPSNKDDTGSQPARDEYMLRSGRRASATTRRHCVCAPCSRVGGEATAGSRAYVSDPGPAARRDASEFYSDRHIW